MRFKFESSSWFQVVVWALAILLPVLIVFRNLFLPGPLAWGDAPQFFPEELKELVGEPLAWTNRGYGFGGVNAFLWISPMMLLYGLLGNFLGNDLTIRLLFYFPSVIFAGLGTYLLTRYLKFSNTVRFFATLTYLLNTYYLLLIDGGQVGVALGFGFFPLSLLYLKKLVDSPSIKTFYLSLLFLVFSSVADPRIAIISVVAIVIWLILDLKVKTLIYLVPLIVCWIGINMYWIFPLLRGGLEGIVVPLSELKTMSWYNPLLLFSPHWPANLFGKIARPPFYFIGVPILIFGGLLLKRDRKILSLTFAFLAFSLLTSYNFIRELPFGFAFRDSTKFFVPLVLFAGILIGSTIDAILHRLKISSYILYPVSYIYLLLLISPALLGKLNFVLSNRQHGSDLQKIYENLKTDTSFYRSVWFPERTPLAYETFASPAVDAKELVKFWPFASLTAGEDVFNFLNNQKFIDWFRILGIRYLVLSDNPREISKNSEEQKDWATIGDLISQNPDLERLAWETNIPIYKVDNTYPRFFAVEKLVGVIGASSTIYHFPFTIFFEDGKFDPKNLEGLDPNSLVLVFDGADKTDLAMSFLQKYFVASNESTASQWAVYTNDQYLKYKYELLIRGVRFADFDYGKGIAFSTIKGEKIEFAFDVRDAGEYVFAYRIFIPEKGDTSFRWESVPLNLAKGKYRRFLENSSDLAIVNTVALVPKKDWEEAADLADTFTKHFKVVKEGELETVLGREKYREVEVSEKGTLKYELTPPQGSGWIIFSDNYHPLWKLKKGIDYRSSVPVFSMVNGFYVEEKWRDLEIVFKGQENVRRGMWMSGVSTLVLAIIYLWTRSSKYED